MRRTPLIAATILSIAALSSCPAPAYAASDSPTPYSVTQQGITLPAGKVFSENDHINIRSTAPHNDLHFEAKCITRTDAECAGAPHDAAQFIGQSFIPWSAFGLVSDYCVVWIQIAGFDEHYGESGQPPVCSPSTPPTETEPTPSPTTPTTSPTPTPTETASPTIAEAAASTDGRALTTSASVDRDSTAPARLAETGYPSVESVAVAVLAPLFIAVGTILITSIRRRRR